VARDLPIYDFDQTITERKRTVGRWEPRRRWLVSAVLLITTTVLFKYQPPRRASKPYKSTTSRAIPLGSTRARVVGTAQFASQRRIFTAPRIVSPAEWYRPKFGRAVVTLSRGWSPQRYDQGGGRCPRLADLEVSLRTFPHGVSRELRETKQEGGCEGRNDQRATKIWNGHIFVISSVALMKALLAGW